MVKKDKIFELKIEEDDELSGVDAVSLVDEPAIEINWVAFNKTHEDFVIPDGEDMKFSSRIIEKGQSEQDLFDDGYEMVKEEFISSQPNSPSFEDTPERLIRYKYVLNPNWNTYFFESRRCIKSKLIYSHGRVPVRLKLWWSGSLGETVT